MSAEEEKGRIQQITGEPVGFVEIDEGDGLAAGLITTGQGPNIGVARSDKPGRYTLVREVDEEDEEEVEPPKLADFDQAEERQEEQINCVLCDESSQTPEDHEQHMEEVHDC